MMNAFFTFALSRSGASGRRPLATCLGLALVVGGCGEEKPGIATLPTTVTGKILGTDGGPLSGGKVVFEPDEDGFSGADGEVLADGTFSLRSGGGEKVQPGIYHVRIESTGSSSNVPAKYKQLATTDLTATVKPGANALEPFHLNNSPPVSRATPGGTSVRD